LKFDVLGPKAMKQTLVWIAAIAGLLSCVLWLFAAIQSVDHDPKERDEHGLRRGALLEIRDDGSKIDVWRTAYRQTYWNRWAALAAAIAAIANAASLMFRYP
jgi:hypothetical protein